MVKARQPMAPQDLAPLLGRTRQDAHGANERRNLAPAGDRLGGVAPMPKGVPITLRRARRPCRRAFGSGR